MNWPSEPVGVNGPTLMYGRILYRPPTALGQDMPYCTPVPDELRGSSNPEGFTRQLLRTIVIHTREVPQPVTELCGWEVPHHRAWLGVDLLHVRLELA